MEIGDRVKLTADMSLEGPCYEDLEIGVEGVITGVEGFSYDWRVVFDNVDMEEDQKDLGGFAMWESDLELV